ncbi:protein PXR1 [Coniochaeta sp. 2T2.1]|nr:protein PXR1 [Coniochaeta sp. 2T2.1]
MGLSAPKRRQLIQTDPNNNNWARNTSTFGQKILRAAGWTPGEFLGAQNSAHAEHHTAASASHIKVVLKEDSLGLGAKRNNGDQCTGLDAFQDLLGRLNGKSEKEIEQVQEKRMAVLRNTYIEQKFGAMRFVPGGWLVGDQETKALEALETLSKEQRADKEDVVSDESGSESSEDESEPKMADLTRVKKRKAEDTEEPKEERKKSKKRKSSDSDDEGETEKESRKRLKKEKKEKKSKKRKGSDESEESAKAEKSKKSKKSKSSKTEAEATTSDDVSDTEAATDRAARKAKKEKRKKERESKSNEDSDTEQKRSKKRRKEKDISVESEDSGKAIIATSTPTPTTSGTSTPLHHRSRARFIAQKRMAFADPKALAQIFMMKPTT